VLFRFQRSVAGKRDIPPSCRLPTAPKGSPSRSKVGAAGTSAAQQSDPSRPCQVNVCRNPAFPAGSNSGGFTLTLGLPEARCSPDSPSGPNNRNMPRGVRRLAIRDRRDVQAARPRSLLLNSGLSGLPPHPNLGCPLWAAPTLSATLSVRSHDSNAFNRQLATERPFETPLDSWRAWLNIACQCECVAVQIIVLTW
jgi:hypothetical protein